MNAISVRARSLEVSVADQPLIGPLDLDWTGARCIALMGPSGCGKTSLARTLIRPMWPYQIKGSITGLPEAAGESQIGYSPQGAHLFRWLTARGNVAFTLRQLEPAASRKRVVELARGLCLPDEVLERAATSLSGGEAQRVALARALAAKPLLRILDEPLGSVDPLRRFECQNFLRSEMSEGTLTLLITHDIEEAVFLADNVEIIDGRPGRIVRTIQIDRLDHVGASWRQQRQFDDHCREIRMSIEELGSVALAER